MKPCREITEADHCKLHFLIIILYLPPSPQYILLCFPPRHMERFQFLMKNSFLEHVFRT